MRVKTLLAGTAAAVLTASPLLAQTQISEEGAEEIRRALAGALDDIRADTDLQIDLAGDIAVAPGEEAYEATIPEATIRIDGGTVTAEPIAMQLMPLENGWYDAGWTLPERLTIEEGGAVGFVDIGSQSNQGVFAPEFETFMSIDVVLEALEVIPPQGEDGSMSLARLALQGESQDLGGGRYSGNYTLSADDFDFVGQPGREELAWGGLRFDWAVTDLDYPAYMEFQNAVEALMAEAEDAPGQAPQAMFQQAAGLLEGTPPLLDGMRARYRIEDLVFADGTQNVDVESGSLAVYLEGLRGDASTFGVEMSSGAVDIVPAPPEAEFFPNQTRVRLALSDLPNDQLLQVVSQFLAGAGEMGPDAAAMMAFVQLQQAVMAGGSTLQIQEVTVVNDTASLDLAGEVVPDEAAAFGVTATAQMTITGLTDLIAQLQQTLGPDAQEAVGALTILQTMGTPAEDGDGRTYDFEVLQTGQVLLNGADIAPLINAVQ
jgi:hypothetical protein